MNAIILAAGRGRRLGGVTGDRPKCLIEVGGRPLIQHQIRALNDCGIRRICVVVGFAADMVLDAVGSAAVCQFNREYAETNSLYSLWLTREWMQGPFLMLNSDLLVDPEIIARAAAAKGSVVTYDSSSPFDEEQMKVSFDGPALRDISKRLAPGDSQGENVGIIRFDSEAAGMLFSEAGEIVADGGENEWAPAAVDRLTDRILFRGIDIAGLPWTEIDFPSDLEHAQRSVWPRILRQAARPVNRSSESSEPSGIALSS